MLPIKIVELLLTDVLICGPEVNHAVTGIRKEKTATPTRCGSSPQQHGNGPRRTKSFLLPRDVLSLQNKKSGTTDSVRTKLKGDVPWSHVLLPS